MLGITRDSLTISGLARRSSIVVVLISASTSLGQQCEPGWGPVGVTHPVGGAIGWGGVFALKVFDDGSGTSLYAGGSDLRAGGVINAGIVRWDGATWFPVGDGLNGTVRGIASYDDGSGSALYVGGSRYLIPSVYTAFTLKWDGSTWSPLGLGVGNPGDDSIVHSMAVFDDGSGPALFVGGEFLNAGGERVNNIAKWDGTNWSRLGESPELSGVNERVFALAVFDDGSGPALYAGGMFTTAGGTSAPGIAKWDGTSWSPVGPGLHGAPYPNGETHVYAMTVFDGGSGSALAVGGKFITSGAVQAQSIAKWDGTSWSQLGNGLKRNSSKVHALTVFDDGSGPELFIGGGFHLEENTIQVHLAKWNGATWSRLNGEMNGSVYAMAGFVENSGPVLYAAGAFTHAGETTGRNTARWDGQTWRSLARGTNERVEALTVFDDGSGPAVYAGGWFEEAGEYFVGRIARWDGSAWSPLADGMNDHVYAQIVFDDGTGEQLYAGGKFTTAGGTPAAGIARWNGSSWSGVGGGMNWWIDDFAVFDDGSGPALFAGGDFTSAGGVSANRIAKWDGAQWSPLGLGTSERVNALAVFDDGAGPALYAGGHFLSANGVTVNGIAKWDGSSWSALETGVNGWVRGWVRALAVFDDGSGDCLYAAGSFATAGRAPANNIAKWDGTSWSPLGDGTFGEILALTVFDDGSGPSLYVGGWFNIAGGIWVNRVAKWNGTSWSSVGNGVGRPGSTAVVRALSVHDFGSGANLFTGGVFISRYPDVVYRIARFGVPLPLLTSPPVDLIVEAGQPAMLAFQAQTGPGPMDTQWRKNGQNLAEDPPRITGTRTPTLSIDPTRMADRGLYDAVLTNACGSITTNSAQLTVTCYPDCDQSTGLGVLDLFDFLCFQNLFVQGDPYACDCDATGGSGVCDIFDFLCFQTAFVSGCP